METQEKLTKKTVFALKMGVHSAAIYPSIYPKLHSPTAEGDLMIAAPQLPHPLPPLNPFPFLLPFARTPSPPPPPQPPFPRL